MMASSVLPEPVAIWIRARGRSAARDSLEVLDGLDLVRARGRAANGRHASEARAERRGPRADPGDAAAARLGRPGGEPRAPGLGVEPLGQRLGPVDVRRRGRLRGSGSRRLVKRVSTPVLR